MSEHTITIGDVFGVWYPDGSLNIYSGRFTPEQSRKNAVEEAAGVRGPAKVIRVKPTILQIEVIDHG